MNSNQQHTRKNPALSNNHNDQQTIPSQAVRPSAGQAARPPIIQNRPQVMPPQIQPRPQAKKSRWMLYLALGAFALTLFACATLTMGAALIYGNGVLPGVHVGDVALGGLSQEEAAQKLAAEWDTLTLRDGDRAFTVPAAQLGISINAEQTAERAYAQGRGEGSLFAALGHVEVSPVVNIDPQALGLGLEALASQVSVPMVNVGVQIVNGQLVERPAQVGRALDVEAMRSNADWSSPVVELIMMSVYPAAIDATPILGEAAALLANPLTFEVYDPVTGDIVIWSVTPERWATWIVPIPDINLPQRWRLSIDGGPISRYLIEQSAVFDETRYIDTATATDAIQDAVFRGETTITVRVHHSERQHVVQSGETVTSIAWDYGIPYLYIQEANGGLTSLSAGQSITIPPADLFLSEHEPVPNKRIVVSISDQHTWVYEDGQLKWDWVASTGIADSPTWPGLYQIIEHVPNAYAGNWNLYMPNFLGVYRPIPGAEFINGFHGFPTRGGGQLLWENSLGTRVTYGCILLSGTNSQLLYDWAEEGVVVEILP